jgi:hypothetical protein
MTPALIFASIFAAGFLVLNFPARTVFSQSTNASITGGVSDSSGAAVPRAEVTLTALSTGRRAKFTAGVDGLFEFPNLQAGAYELQVSATGFRNYVQRGITLNINETARLSVNLQVGSSVQTLQVASNVSPLNFDNAEVKGTINRSYSVTTSNCGGQSKVRII